MKTPDRSPSPPPDEYPALSDALGWDDSVTSRDRVETALLEECVTAATLTAPRHSAPGHCLTQIKSRLAAAAPALPKLNGHTHIARRRPAWPGYGLAAALAVLGGWQTVRVVRLNHELATLKATTDRPGKSQTEIIASETGEPGPAGHSDGLSPNDPSAVPGRGPRGKSRNMMAESILVPDRPALMRKLEELQRLSDVRFQPAPGLARTVVMELQQPGSKPGIVARTPTLSDEVANIIAAGMGTEKPASDKPPFSVIGNDKDRSGDDIVITGGLPNLQGFNLQEGVTLLHKDFPADKWHDWEGLHLLKDGRFYDEINEIIWKPLPGEGHRYLGSKPQEPIILEEQAAPRDAAAPAPPPETATTPTASGPLAWNVYDESRGEGRLVVKDLPPPPQGQAYQLWFEDARSPQMITAGLLPPLDGGAGQVLFSLTPGISPVHYRLTLEPSAGSAQPLGPTILTGP